MNITDNTTAPVLDFGTTDRWELVKGKSSRFELNGYRITIKTADTWTKYTDNHRKARVFVDGYESADFSEAVRLSDEAGSRMRGESVEADKAWDQANRQEVKNMKNFALEAISQIPVLGDLLGGRALSFSRKAGCSMCPCSPGFVTDRLFVAALVEGQNGELVTREFPVEDVFIWKVDN